VIRLLTSLVALAAVALGQTPPCAGSNNTNLTTLSVITILSNAGPNRTAFEFVPTQGMLVWGAQVATANTFRQGTMGLELWDDNPTFAEPLTRLSGGSWLVDNNRPVAWQGTNFDRPVSVTAGTRYWLVFIEPGWSTPAEEPGGTPVPAHRWNYATTSWSPTNLAAKYSIFCSFLDGAGVAATGGPCTSSANLLGTAFTNEAPALGNQAFSIEGSGFPPGALSYLVIGFTPGFPTIPLAGFPTGCTQSTLPVDTLVGVSTAGAGGSGHVVFPLPLPGTSSLAGLVAGLQLAVLDAAAAAPIPFVTSNAVYVTLF